MTSRAFTVLAMAGLLLCGCVSTTPAERELAADAEQTCLFVPNISGFSPLSEREVLVTVGVSDHYLFTVLGICTGLRSATTLAVVERTSRICNDGFGRIWFQEPGLGRQVCQVRDIERVASREEAREIVAARQQARREN